MGIDRTFVSTQHKCSTFSRVTCAIVVIHLPCRKHRGAVKFTKWYSCESHVHTVASCVVVRWTSPLEPLFRKWLPNHVDCQRQFSVAVVFFVSSWRMWSGCLGCLHEEKNKISASTRVSSCGQRAGYLHLSYELPLNIRGELDPICILLSECNGKLLVTWGCSQVYVVNRRRGKWV